MLDNSMLIKLDINMLAAEKDKYLLRERLGIYAEVPTQSEVDDKLQ